MSFLLTVRIQSIKNQKSHHAKEDKIMNSTTPQYCSNCGAEIEIGKNFCADCGANLAQTDTTANQQSGQERNQTKPTAHEKYSNMGGWLLVFTIWNFIFVPISLWNLLIGFPIIEGLFYNGHDAVGIICVFSQIVLLCIAVFHVLYIVKVFQRNPSFLRVWQIGTILIIINVLLVVVVTGMLDADSSVLSEINGNVTGNVLRFLLLTWYYCKSVRVRTYMGSDEYINKAIFAYKTPPVSSNSSEPAELIMTADGE
jgi:hypothetical protein